MHVLAATGQVNAAVLQLTYLWVSTELICHLIWSGSLWTLHHRFTSSSFWSPARRLQRTRFYHPLWCYQALARQYEEKFQMFWIWLHLLLTIRRKDGLEIVFYFPAWVCIRSVLELTIKALLLYKQNSLSQLELYSYNITRKYQWHTQQQTPLLAFDCMNEAYDLPVNNVCLL